MYLSRPAGDMYWNVRASYGRTKARRALDPTGIRMPHFFRSHVDPHRIVGLQYGYIPA